MEPEILLNITDVAERLQVERHKASDLMKLMPCFVMPGSRTRRVREADFQAWIAENVVMPGALPTRLPRSKRKPEPVLDQEYFEPDGRIKRRKTKR